MKRFGKVVRPLAVIGMLTLTRCGGSEPSGPDPNDAIASVSVTPATASIDIGATTALTATVRNGRNEVVSSSVSWSSSAAGVATVTSGLVTGEFLAHVGVNIGLGQP